MYIRWNCAWLGLSVTVRVRAWDREWAFLFSYLKVTHTFVLPSLNYALINPRV